MRRHFRWIFVLLVILLVLLGWVLLREVKPPKLTFVEFRQVDGMKRGIFMLENQSSEEWLYLGAKDCPISYFAKFPVDGAQRISPFFPVWPEYKSHVLGVGERLEFGVPWEYADRSGVITPVHVSMYVHQKKKGEWQRFLTRIISVGTWRTRMIQTINPRTTLWSEQVHP
jgi:hypothetical protein